MANINTEKLKQLLTAMLETLSEGDSDNEKATPQPATNNITTSQNRGHKKYGGGDNLFLNMPEANMHKQDVEIDKLLAPKHLTSRNRPSTLIDVTCRVCGKNERVSRSLVPESSNRYKCNECSKGVG